jgi:hypothetical protein
MNFTYKGITIPGPSPLVVFEEVEIPTPSPPEGWYEFFKKNTSIFIGCDVAKSSEDPPVTPPTWRDLPPLL